MPETDSLGASTENGAAPAIPTLADLSIVLAVVADLDDIAAQHVSVFGPGRYSRTAFRIREIAAPSLDRSLVARRDGELVGSVLQSPVSIGGELGLWLGPIAVTEDGRRIGVGAALMRAAIARAAECHDRFIILVGDESYYGRFGFKPVPEDSIRLPGPVDPMRLLCLSLTPLPIMPSGTVRAPSRE